MVAGRQQEYLQGKEKDKYNGCEMNILRLSIGFSWEGRRQVDRERIHAMGT
jgi:hypothetical protein